MKNRALPLSLSLAFMTSSLVSGSSARGDAQPLAAAAQNAESVQTQDLPQKVQLAFDHLRSAVRLESAHVGDAGVLSENLEQLREILAVGKSEPLLKRLYEEGSLAGKLYAIIGLQLLEDTDLSSALIQDAYQFSEEKLETLEGCILYEKKVGDILRSISQGYYRDDFASAE